MAFNKYADEQDFLQSFDYYKALIWSTDILEGSTAIDVVLPMNAENEDRVCHRWGWKWAKPYHRLIQALSVKLGGQNWLEAIDGLPAECPKCNCELKHTGLVPIRLSVLS